MCCRLLVCCTPLLGPFQATIFEKGESMKSLASSDRRCHTDNHISYQHDGEGGVHGAMRAGLDDSSSTLG